MANYYTEIFKGNPTLKDFVERCKPAIFDEGRYGRMPKEYKPDPYYIAEVNRDTNSLEKLLSLPNDSWKEMRDKEYSRIFRDYQIDLRNYQASDLKGKRRNPELAEKYQNMIRQIKSQFTAEVLRYFKKFMISELKAGLSYDCAYFGKPVKPIKPTIAQYRANKIRRARNDLRCSESELKEHLKSIEEKNNFLQALRDLFPEE